jgi:hypothetical protein
MNSAQSDWGLQQSVLLQALADKTYNWAMQQYSKGEGVTDQAIAGFMEMAGKGRGLAETLTNQYQDQIKPLMDQYIREAGSYASEGRQRFEAGQAMSTVAQADQAAMKAAMDKIIGYGGNVNAGKTQKLMIAEGISDAQARAGAGTKAALDTEATGRQMLEKSIQMKSPIPDQAMAAMQATNASLNGAENAILGLMKAGADLAGAGAPYAQAAAAANKLPPVGNVSQSTSQQSSQQSSRQQSQSDKQSQQTDKEGGGKGQGQPKEGGEKGGGDRDKGGGGSGGGSDGGQKFGPPANIQPGVYKSPGGGDDKEATGEAPDPWSSGPTYVDENGVLTPEYSPNFGRDESGNFLSPDTPGIWDNPAPFGDWAPPDQNQWFNVPRDQETTDAIGGGLYGQGTWAGQPGEPQWEPLEKPYEPLGADMNPGSDGPFDATGSSDAWGGQNFANEANQLNEDLQNANYDSRGGQDFSEYDAGDDTSDFTDAGDDGNDYSYDDYEYDAGDDTSDFTDAGDDYYASDDGGGDDYYQYDAGDDTSDFTDAGDDYYSDDYYDSGGDDYYDDGGDYSDWGDDTGSDWARGGLIPPRRPQHPRMAQGGVMPTTGGPVPRSASPSRGRLTDDISARLNAGEYVIPRDVVKHQGTKFFTDLIAKSRKLRTGMAGAKPGPTMKRALPPGRPTFQSRPLPPR